MTHHSYFTSYWLFYVQYEFDQINSNLENSREIFNYVKWNNYYGAKWEWKINYLP